MGLSRASVLPGPSHPLSPRQCLLDAEPAAARHGPCRPQARPASAWLPTCQPRGQVTATCDPAGEARPLPAQSCVAGGEPAAGPSTHEAAGGHRGPPPPSPRQARRPGSAGMVARLQRLGGWVRFHSRGESSLSRSENLYNFLRENGTLGGCWSPSGTPRRNSQSGPGRGGRLLCGGPGRAGGTWLQALALCSRLIVPSADVPEGTERTEAQSGLNECQFPSDVITGLHPLLLHLRPAGGSGARGHTSATVAATAVPLRHVREQPPPVKSWLTCVPPRQLRKTRLSRRQTGSWFACGGRGNRNREPDPTFFPPPGGPAAQGHGRVSRLL